MPQKPNKIIIDRIIFIQQLNKKKKISLEEPKVEKFTQKKDLISFLQKKNLVVVDSSLIQLWPSLLDEKTYYYLYDNKIEFYFSREDLLLLETQDNIISIKNENNKKYPNLMQLAKIFYFRKFIEGEFFSEHKMKSSNETIVLIKKEIINQYLAYFNYKTFDNILNNIPFDYKNIEQKFDIILESIKNNFSNYYEEIKLKETTPYSSNFDGQEFYLRPQLIKYSEKTLISDF